MTIFRPLGPKFNALHRGNGSEVASDNAPEANTAAVEPKTPVSQSGASRCISGPFGAKTKQSALATVSEPKTPVAKTTKGNNLFEPGFPG